MARIVEHLPVAALEARYRAARDVTAARHDQAIWLLAHAQGTVPTVRPKLLIEGVSKWFRTPRAEVHALHDISLSVAEGEFVCLVGPSGCGKSTLLGILARLTKPDAGRVLADNKPVEGPGRQRLVMFQESALFPWLDTFGNVMFGLKLRTTCCATSIGCNRPR